MRSKFSVTCKVGTAEVVLYDAIDSYFGISAKAVADQLKAAGPVRQIDVRINSPGGNVFEGLAIFNTLKMNPARVVVHVDGAAASIASVICMAGDEIEMSEGSFMFLHNPATIVGGDAEELRDTAELLDKLGDQISGIYRRRTGLSADRIGELMAAETWLTADEAVSLKFADRAVAGLRIAANIDLSHFHNVPEKIKDSISMSTTTNPATLAELKAALGPDVPADFLIAQMEAGASLVDAQAAYIKRLQADMNRPAPQTGKSGVQPVADRTSGRRAVAQSGEFWDLVNELVKQGVKRPEAIRRVAKENPDAHGQMLLQYNQKHGGDVREIEDRFGVRA